MSKQIFNFNREKPQFVFTIYRLNSFCIIRVYKSSVCIPQETHGVSAIKINMMKEIDAVYCESHTKHALCGQNAVLVY